MTSYSALLCAAACLAIAQPARGQVPDSVPHDTAISLPDITVITRAPAPLARLPRAISETDSTELRRGRTTTGLADALGNAPGVLATERGSFALDQRIAIRGAGSRAAFGTRGVTILLDGVPQTLPDGQSQLTNVDLAELDRIEVLSGPASALYGNGAGGVLSFASAPAASAPFAGRARLVAGGDGLFKWDGWGSVRRGRLGGTAFVSRTTIDGYRAHSAADLHRLSLGGFWDDGTTDVTLHFRAADDPRADNPGALTPAEYASDPDAAAPNNLEYDAGKSVRQQQLSVIARHHDGSGNRYELTAFGVLRQLDNPLATNTLVRIRRRAGGLRAVVTRPLQGVAATGLSIGVDAQWLRDDRGNFTPAHSSAPDTVLWQLERVTEIGPFAHAVVQPAPRWLVEAGVRYDAVRFQVEDRLPTDGDDSGDRTMGAWSGSAGISLVLSPGLTPYLDVATAYETPTTTELAVQQGGTGGFNPALGPQRTVTAELGARGSLPCIRWSLAGYAAWVSNAIIPFEELGGRSYYTNAGRITNLGLEVRAGLHPIHGWSASGSWTLARNRFSTYRLVSGTDTTVLDGHALAGLPASRLRLSLRGDDGRRWIAVDQTLMTGLWGDDANTIRVNGWGQTDIRAGWQIDAGRTRLSPFVGVTNLWNSRHVGSVTINGFGGRVLEPAAGRSMYAGIGLDG